MKDIEIMFYCIKQNQRILECLSYLSLEYCKYYQDLISYQHGKVKMEQNQLLFQIQQLLNSNGISTLKTLAALEKNILLKYEGYWKCVSMYNESNEHWSVSAACHLNIANITWGIFSSLSLENKSRWLKNNDLQQIQ